MERRVTPLPRRRKISAILQKTTPSAKSKKRSTVAGLRTVAFAVLVGLLALALYPHPGSATFRRAATAPEAGSDSTSSPASTLTSASTAGLNGASGHSSDSPFSPYAAAPSAALFMQAAPEDIGSYAADCTTPKTDFVVGETACAKVTGTLFGLSRIYWISPEGGVVQVDPIGGSALSATRTVSARGGWRLYLVSLDISLRKAARFSVKDAADPAVDLTVVNNLVRGLTFAAGESAPYRVTLTNNGPDAAANVVLTETALSGLTFVSATEPTGRAACSNTSTVATCNVGSLAAQETVTYTFAYTVNTAPVGTEIANTAAVATTTDELHLGDNASTAFDVVVSATETGTDCVLECPNDMVVTANTTNDPDGAGGNDPIPGAVVNFGSAEAFGTCGAVAASPASGTFFPVGTTTVSSTSAEGGGTCSFKVTVAEGGGPTISCPASVTTTANGCEATVDPGTPTTSAGAAISSERSDGQPLEAPFGTGATTIIWTATDAAGRVATCTQTVTVNVSDTTAPTITAPADLTLPTGAEAGSCGLIVSEASLGTPAAEDGGCSVDISRTGVPAGNFFPVGTTTVTWKATDAAGNTATDTQTVTVTETTPPAIRAPADAQYACLSEVPAADASQATGADDNLPNGGPIVDNCGVTPTVTVSEAQSGIGSASSPLIITRTFTASDGVNSANSVQTITVIDDTPPTIALVGANSMTHECHTPFEDPGVTKSDTCDTSVAVTTSGGFNPDVPGTYTITYTAADDAGNTATAQRTVTVVDTIKPVITLNGASTMTVECHTPFADPGATAADNPACDANVPVTSSGSVDVNTPGTYTITYAAADDSGNAAATVTRTVTVVDTIAPAISCPTNIVVTLPANSTATSMPVNFSAPTATDSCDASVPVTTSHASGSVFNVGTTTVTASATDDSSNSSSCSFTVTVLYNFTGFFSPVNNLPVVNSVNAGRAVPLKFSLSGNKGLGIFATGYPASQQIACDSSAPLADLEGTVTSGGSTLTYSPDQYHYSWKTDNSWAGTCRVLVVKLNDGSEHTALFKFK